MVMKGVDVSDEVHPILVDADGRPYVITSGAITNTETDDNTIDGGEVREAPLALTYGWEDEEGVWKRLRVAQAAEQHALFVWLRGVTGNILTRITDGTEIATVSPDGYLDVKTHTPDKCFASDYAGAQAAAVIITPTAGKKIRIVSSYVSTNTVATDITLAFGTSGNIFFKLYTAQRAAQTGNEICALGAVDETIKLTCGAATFVSIGYDEV